MEEDKGAAGGSSAAAAPPPSSSSNPPKEAPASSSNPPPPPPASSSNPPKETPAAAAAAAEAAEVAVAAAAPRQMFSVELKPGETTIVSWKKLLRESSKGGAEPSPPPAAADPVPATAVQPSEGEISDALPPPNRFSAVIEKIERLYMGKQSSDEEELDDVPDDDQYDTEDSFIDDAELDEYFQVDKLSTKHNGYFVNRGKLERIESSSSPNLAPKKRRRKDSTTAHSEKDLAHSSDEPVNMGNMRIKAAARNAPLVGKKLINPAKMRTSFGEHYEEAKFLKNKLNTPAEMHKKRSADFAANLENPQSMKISTKDVTLLALEARDYEKNKVGISPSRELAHKSRGINESTDAIYRSSRDRSISSQTELQSKKLLNGAHEAEVSAKIRRKERYSTGGYPDMNPFGSSYPVQAVQHSSATVKENSAMRPKGTTLERAIRDLEKIVAVCRPPKLDVREQDAATQGVKRRLPPEVRQKLAKVARLSASQGKISEKELVDRLMSSVGHLVQRRTLKKHLREMVELGLSAKQQKADKFQQIKKEVTEMIRARVSHLKSKGAEQQDGSADDFQEVNNKDDRTILKKYKMDTALEDKICDLYDLYVEGMDEDKGPQSRKLYVELAELWPYGRMDNYGIKDAIYRSKQRKRAAYRQHKFGDDERVRRKKLASRIKVEETGLGAQVQAGQQEKAVTDSAVQVFVAADKSISNQPVTSTVRMTESTPSSNDSGHPGSKHHDKVRAASGSTVIIQDNGSKAGIVDVKKKIKRKSESDLGEDHAHPTKLPSLHGKERHSSHKHSSDEANVSQPKQNPQLLPAAPGPCDQPS